MAGKTFALPSEVALIQRLDMVIQTSCQSASMEEQHGPIQP